MRIGLFHATLPEPGRKLGGVEVFVDRLADALAARGHAVTVLSFSPVAPAGARYDHRPIGSPALAGRGARLTRGSLALNHVDWSAFDVLSLHGDDWFFVDRPLPTVRSFYGSALWEARTATSLRRRVVQSLVFPAELLASRLADRSYGAAAQMPAGYRLDGRLPLATRAPSDALASEPRAQHPVVLFVGTWDGRKRGRLLHELFIRSVRPALPDAELWMVSDRCEPADGVRWFASPDDEELERLYRRAWVLCLPSTYEGFGLPYLEAMQLGSAVVASPNPGAQWLTDDGRTGVIARDEQLASAVEALLRDRSRREQLAAAGLARSREFGWDAACAAHELALEDAITAYRGAGSPRLALPGRSR